MAKDKEKENKKSNLEQDSVKSNKVVQKTESMISNGTTGSGLSDASRQNVKSYLMNNLSSGDEYLADNIIDYLEGANTRSSSFNSNIYSIMSDNLYGIEGMPYQFHETIDRRIDGSTMGRKFADKVYSQMPLL